MSDYPPNLAEIVSLFASLSEDEKRENLIAYADAAPGCAPSRGETFDLEDVRKDADAWDRWMKTAEIHDPPEIAKARDAAKRGELLLAEQKDEESIKAFEEAREDYRAALERGK